ncbi:sulfate adenylyltransferase subunit 1 [Flavisolibacter ginsengisoli]|jgi:sulfate adenylyltransferase subunit 1|uniref:sulfate adenylyltransferase n=1 Tax=Flavisolibacter ginsengisoli DSM 18119 TaxID=1121884 RepID=A0A1M4UQ85_9BACT|nr:GTP-binding protein [Flavisolibacter ginsengisoli]SHE58760.1 sulfate adenylyltransferase subunit 1 [Flavisolibacter ginsengisoli DSM 18119]
MDLLRFITAGSVDDGKSTLIGRLLYDSKSILADQLETLKKQSKTNEHADIDLALLTDGLRAEREQGITIDVAYKYFSTPVRKFIIADAPGHIQYTRNMITGASNSDCIIILIDARNGVIEQTRRHSIIASLLKIPHVIVAINKMDMVGYDKNVFTKIVSQYQDVARELQLEDVYYIPISALKGDNIITNSLNLAWFEGNSLLTHLENIEVIKSKNSVSRFSVQYVIRPQAEELHDYRGYAGKISSGTYSKGDEVRVFPSSISTSIKQIEVNQKEVQTAYAGQSVTIHLQDDIDISRGDVIVRSNELPKIQNEFEVLMCWMDSNELNAGNRYILQHGSRRVKALVRDIQYKLDVNTLSQESYPGAVKLNDVVKATIKTAEPLAFDSYLELPVNGSAILIDQTSNMTVGACLIQ